VSIDTHHPVSSESYISGCFSQLPITLAMMTPVVVVVIRCCLYCYKYCVVVLCSDDVSELHGPVYDEVVPRTSGQTSQATSGRHQGPVS